MLVCNNCKKQFPNTIQIDGEKHKLSGRRFCPECSPVGGRNRRTYIVSVPEGHAHCVRCRQTKDLSKFHRRPDSGKPLSYCQDCQTEAKILKFEEKIEKALSLKGGACIDCGGIFPSPVYQFRTGNRPFPISKMRNMSWQRIEKILENGELLCLNCGAIRDWAEGQGSQGISASSSVVSSVTSLELEDPPKSP